MTTTTDATGSAYVLERSPQEYERLRAQARMWNHATSRAFDEVGLGAGQRCLDAGCGPGETMRLMADRVGAVGAVLGVDLDAGLLASTRTAMHREGYGQCDVAVHDVTLDEPLPGAPYDLVYARFLLFHLPRADASCAGCGTPSRRAAACSCRTTTCGACGCSRRWRRWTTWSAS